MKIGIYTPYLETLTGGERYMMSIAEVLSKDNDVRVFWGDGDILRKAEERFDMDLSRVKTDENVFSNKHTAVDRLKKTLPYDRIVYLSDGSLPLLVPGKLIVHFQQPIKRERVSILDRLKIKQARRIICNSKFTKKYIDDTYGVNSDVLYPPAQRIGVDGDKKNIILSVGRYQPYENGSDYKKLSFMMDAFLSANLLGWELHVVTSVREEDENEFKANIQRRVSGPVKVIKNANFRTLKKEYQQAKIYWHAAGFGENMDVFPERAEHFGMSTVEAMSAGCVPVVVNLGGQREIVENKKNGIVWSTEEELVKGTLELVKNTKFLSSLSSNAVVDAKRYGYEKFKHELVALV